MDIRCGNCSKLFRVADEKIAGRGVRFKCTKCGETITITKQDLEMDLLARQGGDEEPTSQEPSIAPPPPQPPTPPPSPAPEPEAREYKPPPPEPEESDEQEFKVSDTPAAGMDTFDFSAPDVAAQHAQQADAGLGDFSFGDQGGFNGEGDGAGASEEGGEVALSEEDQQAAVDAFSFPTEMISEPTRKPAFAAAGEAEQEGKVGTQQLSEAAFDLSGPGDQAAGQEQTGEQEPASAAPRTGPVFTPPQRPKTAEAHQAEAEIDLGAALAIPTGQGGESEIRRGGREESAETLPFEDTGAFPSSIPKEAEIHPLASGNATGTIAGIGCALPIVLLLYFGFEFAVKFVPALSSLPYVRLVALAGAGTISLGILIGLVVALIQAGAGRKIFFLVNILAGSLFGALFGAAATAAVLFRSGGAFDIVQLSGGAINGGISAFAVSILLVIVRRIMIFTKEEKFSASMTGGQKAGLLLSLLVIGAAGYGQSTFTGTFEQTARNVAKQEITRKRVAAPKPARITPDGLEIVEAAAYVERETGDLVITGSVRNNQSEPKEGWYLEVGVLDGSQSRLATVVMVNGVQLLTRKEYAILEKRGTGDLDTLKSQMTLAVLSGTIPAGGSEPFELHLMEPPAGMASILPDLKSFDPAVAFAQLTAEMR